MPNSISSKSGLLLFAIFLMSCRTLRVYKDSDKPNFYSNEKIPTNTDLVDSLNVVTFNIKKAEKIELATIELKDIDKNRNVDIYLLQEMAEQGVKTIAGNLGLNYLYIPIVYDETAKKNIGNAILTKGTIECPEKLILPHAKWLSKSRRDVTIGEVNVHQKKILVYSVHTETMMMGRKNRMDQLDAIIEHARIEKSGYKYVLIGGDFNTLFTKSGNRAIEKFNGSGYNWCTANIGSTATAFFGLIKPRHDYFFSTGLKLINACKIETSRSSDHYPIFATFGY